MNGFKGNLSLGKVEPNLLPCWWARYEFHYSHSHSTSCCAPESRLLLISWVPQCKICPWKKVTISDIPVEYEVSILNALLVPGQFREYFERLQYMFNDSVFVSATFSCSTPYEQDEYALSLRIL